MQGILDKAEEAQPGEYPTSGPSPLITSQGIEPILLCSRRDRSHSGDSLGLIPLAKHPRQSELGTEGEEGTVASCSEKGKLSEEESAIER